MRAVDETIAIENCGSSCTRDNDTGKAARYIAVGLNSKQRQLQRVFTFFFLIKLVSSRKRGENGKYTCNDINKIA